MKIYILAGDNTDKIATALAGRAQSSEIHGSNDIGKGLTEVELLGDVDKLVVMDSALVVNNQLLKLDDVFKALGKISSARCEVLFITTADAIYDKFTEVLFDNPNCRISKVSGITPSKLMEIINNKTQKLSVSEETPKIEQKEVQSIQDIEQPKDEDVVEITNIKPLEPYKVSKVFIPASEEPAEQEPVPVVQEPKIERKVEPAQQEIKNKKSSKMLSKVKSSLQQNGRDLSKIFTSPKVLLVIGNPNSGSTSTACELFNTASRDNVKSILIDADFSCVGTTMYYCGLDRMTSTTMQKSGLLNSLNNLSLLDDSVYKVSATGHLLGNTSEISALSAHKYSDLDDRLSDIISSLTVDYKLVIVHMELDTLLKNIGLVRSVDSVLFATNCNINSLYNIRKFLGITPAHSQDDVRKLSLLYRKMRYVLCNVSLEFGDTVSPDNFLDTLENIHEAGDLVCNISGVITHKPNFDYFDDTKTLFSNVDQKTYSDILYNTLFS